MYAVQRRNKILKILQQKNFAQVSELSKIFGVSEVTIRNDLRKLKEEGLIERNYGGATLSRMKNIPLSNEGPTFSIASRLLSESKSSIARAAFGLVSQGDTLFLDASSTALHLAMILKSMPNISVISNSIPVFEQFKEYKDGILIGIPGILSLITQSFVGPQAEKTIRELRAHKAFITPKAIIHQGLRDNSIAEASIRKLMIDSSDEVIILADHSKFGNQRTLFGIDSLDSVDVIVTDKTPDSSFLELFEKKNIRLIIAEEDKDKNCNE
jgi:DeoR/GlpR family transcriptional regulator of sugar metabolism